MIDSIALASQRDSALAFLANAVLVIAQAHMNATKNIACLPSEILSHIFIIHRGLHRDSAWPDDTLPSIPISHVSKTWRGTALSTASLWSTLVSSPFHLMPFYEAMLCRSKESLLTIVINVDKAAMGPDFDSANMLAVLVASQAQRLHTLRIDAPYHFIHRHAPSFNTLYAPYLIYVSVSNQSRDRRSMPSSNQRDSRIFTGGAGQLVRFESDDIGLLFQPPLGAITHMRFLLRPDFYDALNETLIEASKTIRHLDIMFSSIQPAVPAISRITMPSLVIVDFMGTASLCLTLLGIIQAPSVELLRLYVMPEPQVVPQPYAYEETTVHFPKLHTLLLLGELQSGLLTAFPTITQLFIHESTQPTKLHDLFDSNQRAFASLTPDLAIIVAPSTFRDSIEAFCAVRSAIGIPVPRFQTQCSDECPGCNTGLSISRD